MRVLLIGGAGYVGSKLTLDLLSRGYEVTIFDRLVFGLPFIEPRRGLEVYQGDIRDKVGLRAILKTHDAVVHLAFASNDPAYRLPPGLAEAINLAPMPHLLSEVMEASVARFVFLSSCSVYGASADQLVTEDSHTAPLTDYAKHKLRCENIIRDVAPGSDLCWTILRPATVTGCSPRQRLDLLLNRMLVEAILEGTIRVHNRYNWRPVLPIRELVSVIAYILSAPQHTIRGATFNVAFECQTVTQWAKAIQALAGSDVELVLPADPGNDGRTYVVSSERLRHETGYCPQHSVGGDLKELMVALRRGNFPDPLTAPCWSNLETQSRHDFTQAFRVRRVL